MKMPPTSLRKEGREDGEREICCAPAAAAASECALEQLMYEPLARCIQLLLRLLLLLNE